MNAIDHTDAERWRLPDDWRPPVQDLIERFLLPRFDALPHPAVIYLDPVLKPRIDEYAALTESLGVALVYAAKACSFPFMIRRMAARVQGISVSTIAEARIVREALGDEPVPLHMSGPSVTRHDWDRVAALADYVNVNSLSALSGVLEVFRGGPTLGLRINPGIRTAKDTRYDPAAPHSRLGVPIARFERWVEERGLPERVVGLHFHTCCQSVDFASTARVLEWLADAGPWVERLEYVNMGGGWEQPRWMANVPSLRAAIARLATRTDAALFSEPGGGIIRHTAVLAARIIDIVDAATGRVAIVDTSVCHTPEVFEYQWSPDVYVEGRLCDASDSEGSHVYQIAGSSCLAGDVFGNYDIGRPLRVGEPVFFLEQGSYSTVKASMFNGLLLPTVMTLSAAGEVTIVLDPGFDHYRSLHQPRREKVPK